MAKVTIEVPDTLTTQLAHYGISDEEIQLLVVQVMEMWLQAGEGYLSQKLIRLWLEALEDYEDVRDVEYTEQLLVDDPGAFMTLEEFNAAYADDGT